MKCENPSFGWRRKGINKKTGKFYPPFKHSPDLVITDCLEQVVFPCGHCFSCLKNKARDLMVRAYYESLCHKHSSFVTLTVNDASIDDVFPGGSLDHRPFQLFMKRLRKALGFKVRYLMCGEYGETSLRPHYHVILFGLGPDDKQPLFIVKSDPLLGTQRQMFSGFLRSNFIESAWPFGNVYIGSVSPASIAYVSGYTMKSFTLGRDNDWYASRSLLPEYSKWSRRPGLGADYFVNHINYFVRSDDLLDDDFFQLSASVNGHSMSVPQYFRNKFYLHDREGFDKLIAYQMKSLRLSSFENPVRDAEVLMVNRARLETARYLVENRKRL